MAYVRAILGAYARAGKSPEQALHMAQIAPEHAQTSQAFISAAQMEWLTGAAMKELDDEALGWFSRPLPWGSYGMLARASISAPTLGVALKRWCRHHGLITRDIALKLQQVEGVATLSLSEAVHLGPVREFCLVSVLRNVLGLACWAIDSRISLRAVHCPFAAPPHRAAYDAWFDAPVRFEAPAALLQFDARYLELPLRRDEAALQHMLRRALPLTVGAYHRDRLLAQRVRQVLGSGEPHTAHSLAATLHLSARSLHRQLKDEGCTLQSLKDEVRRERAQALLLRSQLVLKQVARLAGFRNEKSFSRAFLQWTGQSPGAFRATRGHAPPAAQEAGPGRPGAAPP
jgi:AraC-like DNA-binding protein